MPTYAYIKGLLRINARLTVIHNKTNIGRQYVHNVYIYINFINERIVIQYYTSCENNSFFYKFSENVIKVGPRSRIVYIKKNSQEKRNNSASVIKLQKLNCTSLFYITVTDDTMCVECHIRSML